MKTNSLFVSFYALTSLLMLSFVFYSTTAHAQTAEEFGVVINLAGKQRMLTQKMSKEVMLVALDVNKDENLKNLAATSSLFDKTLTALKDGDAELRLPPTSSKRIIRQLGKVEKLWADFYPNIKGIIESGSVSNDQMTAISNNNLPLLKEMNKAVGAYEKEATKGGLKADPGLAATLNLSGKQRMLTQKMSKEFFLVANGISAEENRLNMLETFTLFERTLAGLKNGDDTLGLPPTTDTNILAQLETVSQLWSQAKPVLEASSIAQTAIAREQIEVIAKLNLPLLKEMNKAVGMYENLAK